MSLVKLPSVDQIGALLSEVLAKGVEVEETGDSLADQHVTALYTNEEGEAMALCMVDLELAACIGAAFTLVPARTAIEAAAETELPDFIAETLHEVFNIATQVFRPGSAAQRIIFKKWVLPMQDLEVDVAGLRAAGETVKMTVSIDGYTSGTMEFCVL